MRFYYLTVVLIILLPILIFFLSRGVALQSEGFILVSSERITQGQIPYKDFNFPHTPLSIFATAGALAIHPSVLSTRILVLITSLLSCLLLYKISILSVKKRIYATLSIFLFVAWGPTHINYIWPVNFAILTTLLSCYLLLKFLETRKSAFLSLAGLSTFAIFLANQNIGIIMFLPILIFFLVKSSRKAKYILTFTNGYLWGVILFCVYLLLTDSFKHFILSFGINMNPSHNETLIFYLLPLTISFFAFILLCLRRRFHLLFLPAACAAFYIDTTFAYLLSMTGVPFMLYLRYNISINIRYLLFALIFFLIGLGFYTAPSTRNNYFFANPKMLVFVDKSLALDFEEFRKVTDNYSKVGDPIFASSEPMIYFLTDRRSPDKNSQIDYGDVLGNLVAKEIKIIFLEKNEINALPIKDYVTSNYRKIKSIGSKDVYIRNQ